MLGVKLGKIETEPGLKEIGQKQFQQDDFQSRLFLNTFSMCGGQKNANVYVSLPQASTVWIEHYTVFQYHASFQLQISACLSSGGRLHYIRP